MLIPNNYSRVTFTLNVVGSTRIVQTSLDFRNGLFINPVALLNQVRTAMVASGRPLDPASMFVGWNYVATKCTLVTASGTMFVADDFTLAAGAVVAQSMSMNTSVLIRKTVAQAGRKYRGRLMFPPCQLSEGNVSQAGQITPSHATVIQNQWNATYGALTAIAQPVLLHTDPLIPPTDITSFTLNPRIGTIGKRLRGS